MADSSGHVVQGIGVRWQLACWDCGFESHRGMDVYLFMSVMCCLVEVSARGQSLLQRSPTKCGVSECDI
jgi:hypothetical protein